MTAPSMEDVQCAIRLIAAIENYPVLYDHNADGYHNRTEQEKAWHRVAQEVQESVSSCKEKWKNIRGSLSRHLRQQQTETGKRKKAYYLAKYLDFLIPFTKTRSSIGSSDYGAEKRVYSPDDSQSEMVYMEGEQYHYLEPAIKVERCDEDESPSAKRKALGGGGLLESSLTPHCYYSFQQKPAKRPPPQTLSSYIEDPSDPDLDFFKSLLPDVRLMTRTQRNRFKVTVINALEDALADPAGGEATARPDNNQPVSDCSSTHRS